MESLGSSIAAGAAAGEAISVSAAMTLVKQALESLTVTVCGEVSELSDKPGYKAVYFTLSDKGAAMSCLMWHDAYRVQELRLKTGMLVEVSGRFSVWAAKGRMNFTVRRLRLAGEGDLRLKVARLAEKLRREGLMEAARKRTLPSLPQRIAVVTSPRGKAVHDCLRTLKRRFPLAEVLVCGVTVEGQSAASEIIRGLGAARDAAPDVILLVRGGGSYEDLMPFNDEQLARCIARCSVPVVTGIGHEPDNSIADMVADLRCSTPTAAAEAVTSSVEEIRAQADGLAMRLGTALQARLRSASVYIETIASRPVFADAGELVGMRGLMVDSMARRLTHAIPDALQKDVARCSAYEMRIRRMGATILDAGAVQSARLEESLVRAGTDAYGRRLAQLALIDSRLCDLSPLAVLSRGYAIVYGSDGRRVIDSVEDVQVGEGIQVRVQDGMILGGVEALEKLKADSSEA